jgi:hypothetical protein
MASLDNKDREEEALDALIVAAFRSVSFKESDLPDLSKPAPELSKEDQEALDALGPDLISKIVSGETKKEPEAQDGSAEIEPELAGALNRADEDTELSKKAREEMERKIREAESEDEEEPEE